MAEKKSSKSTGVLGILDMITAVLLGTKLLESPYLEHVPFWSFNPFQFSVFIVYVWVFWILLTLGVISIILLVTNKRLDKEVEKTTSDVIKNIMKKYNMDN